MAVAAILTLGWATLTLYGALAGGGPIVVDPAVTPFFGPHHINAYFSRIIGLYDARGQTLAHLVMVLAIAGVVAFSRLGPTRVIPLGRRLRRGWLAAAICLCGAAALYFGTTHRPIAYVAGAVLFLLGLAVAPLRRGIGNRALAGAAVLALAAVTLPGFFLRPDLSHITWWEVCFSQAHYVLAIAPSDLLAAGRILLEDVQPVYGLALPVLGAALERALGPLSLGGWVHLLQGLQAVYLFLAAFLFWRHARGRWGMVLFAFAMVFPWYHFNHRGLFYPNQTPWRTMAIPLAVLAVYFVRDQGLRVAALILGGTSGAAVLFNPESGVAVMAGSLAYLAFRYRLPGPGGLLAGILFPAGALGSGLLGAALARIALGYWVDVSRLLETWRTAFLAASGGFDGRPLSSDPWPVLIFAHAAFVLIHGALRRESGFAPSFRAFLATTLLVWFAYYANRPHPWNLSSFYLLYGFLLIDSLRYVQLNLRRRRVDDVVVSTVAALLLIALPNLYQMAAKGAQQVAAGIARAGRKGGGEGGRLVSGVYLPEPGATELLQKAAFIRSRAGSGPPVYLTSDSYLVPKVAGVFPPLPAIDACWEIITRQDYQELLAGLTRPGHDVVYFDAPGTLAHDNTTCWEFYARIRLDLGAQFERGGVEQGWEVWRRRGP
ncbi:MAG TPA: hypothetical protein VN461_22870 [Vicinamibacteria bacterium]|nr:hypothetical protein [Vicinamibacteria bacterium]